MDTASFVLHEFRPLLGVFQVREGLNGQITINREKKKRCVKRQK